MDNSQDKPPFDIKESVTRGGTVFELLEYHELHGNGTPGSAEQLYTLNRSGARLRQLRIRLNNDAVRTEPGALQFLRGNIEMQSDTGTGGGVGGLLRGAIAAARTGETLFKPMYKGVGELYLEPGFHHYWLMEIKDETLFADQGLFACCEDSITVGAHKVESFSARMAGGEGRYQTKISGSGVIVLNVPVALHEIIPITLNNETLQVDGSFALLRTGDVHFTVEKASNSYIGAVTSGEGLLQTFRGTGTVWLAPTLPVYEKMLASLGMLNAHKPA